MILPTGSFVFLAVIDEDGSTYGKQDSASAVQLVHREAEQTGKPTYRSYSSIPIEQESGPRAARSEEEAGGQGKEEEC